MYTALSPFTIEFEKVKSMNISNNTKKKTRDVRRLEMKDRIINRQSDTIEDMKKQISSLEIDVQEKDALLKSMDNLLDDMRKTVHDIDAKKDEYDKLIEELRNMKNIFNEEVFKNKWWLIKFLIR